MKAQIVFILFAVSCSMCRGQECSDEMTKLYNCMIDKGSNDDGMMDKAKACFEKNNCKMSEPGPAPKDDGNSSKGGDDFGQCISEKIDPIMEQCMKSKGITIPKFPGGGPMGHGGPPSRRPVGGGPPPVPVSCEKANDVWSCLENITPPSIDDIQRRLQKMCDTKKKCIAELSHTCQDMVKNAKTKACECSTEKKSELSTAVSDCFNGNSPPFAEVSFQGACRPDPCEGGFQRGPLPGPSPSEGN